MVCVCIIWPTRKLFWLLRENSFACSFMEMFGKNKISETHKELAATDAWAISIIYRFLPEYWCKNCFRLMKGYKIKTALESIQQCLCSNYAEPSAGVTQICPQAVLVNLYSTVCHMIRDGLKLWVVPLITLPSSCRLLSEKF